MFWIHAVNVNSGFMRYDYYSSFAIKPIVFSKKYFPLLDFECESAQAVVHLSWQLRETVAL
jgi:hypothetical protein